ncbi:MAG: RNA-guided pseudouridylation complex pseudouridine synthase subunit Cbf5 [Candidatus Bathyarchaeia archaeon]
MNEATKVLKVLLEGGKEYVCVMQLHAPAGRDTVERVLGEFQGEIYQRPPLRASVKRTLRTRMIYYIHLVEVEANLVLFKVGCQAGTYVRKLCFDIGQVLGTGAHMRELRRTRVGPFTEEKSLVSLEALAQARDEFEEGDPSSLLRLLQPVEDALAFVPKMVVRDSAVDALCHGADLAVPGILSLDKEVKVGSTVAVFTLKGEVIALGRALMSTRDILENEKGLAVKTERVVMKPGTYPRKWGS